MEVWTKDKESVALLYRVHEAERTIFKEFSYDFYQKSPLGWIKIGKTHYCSSKKVAIQRLSNLGYQKDPDQKNPSPLGDLLTL